MKDTSESRGEPRAFHGGAFFDDIGTEFNDLSRRLRIINADVVDAWYDPSPRAIGKLREYLPWLVKTSPPVHAAGLMATIADVRGVPADNLVIGGGSSDLMYLALPHLAPAGSRVLMLDPMYGEYSHIMEHVLSVETTRCFQRKEDRFRVDVEPLLSAARDADLVILVNPNNPTGRYVRPGGHPRAARRPPPRRSSLHRRDLHRLCAGEQRGDLGRAAREPDRAQVDVQELSR